LHEADSDEAVFYRLIVGGERREKANVTLTLQFLTKKIIIYYIFSLKII